MSLLEELKDWYKDSSYPPDGKDVNAELVDERDNDDLRWGTHFTNVYKRDEEYVAVDDVRPATENQDWGDYGEPDIYRVEPRMKVTTVTTYVKIDSEPA